MTGALDERPVAPVRTVDETVGSTLERVRVRRSYIIPNLSDGATADITRALSRALRCWLRFADVGR
jgi:hypothetical protein